MSVTNVYDSINNNHQLMMLIAQVQAADQAYPQLPQQLRDDIDAVLEPTRPYKNKNKEKRKHG